MRVIDITCPDKTFRTLADTLALSIIASGLSNTVKYPGKDFSGDLAKKIGIRLAFQGRAPLTPEEKVACASYAQHSTNLDEITGSNRISSLLAEDLQILRSTKKSGKAPKKLFLLRRRLLKIL